MTARQSAWGKWAMGIGAALVVAAITGIATKAVSNSEHIASLKTSRDYTDKKLDDVDKKLDRLDRKLDRVLGKLPGDKE